MKQKKKMKRRAARLPAYMLDVAATKAYPGRSKKRKPAPGNLRTPVRRIDPETGEIIETITTREQGSMPSSQ